MHPLVPVPDKPLSLDEVIERYPVIRQSHLSKFDDCALTAYFNLAYSQGWSTHPQARGIIFHRFAAEALRVMKKQDSNFIPKGVALAILEEMLEQRNVEPNERVRLPLREIPDLRMAVTKFAKDNRFTIRNVVDVEVVLEATLKYVDDDGVIRERVLSGTPDVLVADPDFDRGSIVIDWKETWGLPPERHADAKNPGLSYHGFFQQRFYAWLVMKNYPEIDQVTLREFYPRRSAARPASLHRDELERVEKELSNIVLDYDRALMTGKPKRLKFPDVEPWKPSPGQHCYYCPRRTLCPIKKGARAEIVVTTLEEAKQAVEELAVIEAGRKSRRESMRPWVENNGPVEAKHSKGRYVFGLRTNKSGRPDLVFFVPEGADRAPTRQPEDEKLEDALKRSVAQAKADRIGAT